MKRKGQDTSKAVASEAASNEIQQEDSTEHKPELSQTEKESKFRTIYNKILSNKKLSIPLSVVLFFIIIFSIPFTRYNLMGLVISRDVIVTVTDSETAGPVSLAKVEIDGKTSETDAAGVAVIKNVKLGNRNVTITKAQYESKAQRFVAKLIAKNSVEVKLVATGRQAEVTIVNRISQTKLAEAKITAGESTAKTDGEGKAMLVVPASVTEQEIEISLDGYNTKKTKISISPSEVSKTTIEITPTGKIYFLSKRTGKLDVMKSDLDGENQEVILAATGQENEVETRLYSTKDWKYLALQARRDSGNAKLYLIRTEDNSIEVIDQGDAIFNVTGWDDHHLIFELVRNSIPYWQEKHNAVKIYNADDNTLTLIDESKAQGDDQYTYINSNMYPLGVVDGKLIYYNIWQYNTYNYGTALYYGDKTSTISESTMTGEKRVLKEFIHADKDGTGAPILGTLRGYFMYASATPQPNSLYLHIMSQDADPQKNYYFEFLDGELKETSAAEAYFTKGNYYDYPTYLQSPDKSKVLWSENRDGKLVQFIADDSLGNQVNLAATLKEKTGFDLSEFKAYGWFGEGYVLLSKNDSELYIMSKDATAAPVKVTDYHRPEYGFRGYGGGYGGGI